MPMPAKRGGAHSECEREDALGDADGEAGGSSGEVSFESHLLFQVGEDAFDHEPGRGERSLAAEVGRGSCLVRGEQGRAGGCEPRLVVAAPEALVGDHDCGRGAGQEVGERLVLLLVGGHDRVAERQAAIVGQKDEPYTPDVAVGGGGEAVAGEAGELAPLGAAGVAVLLFDYRGYGGNPGRPSEQGLARDVRAAHRFLIEEAEVAPARLLYYGESLGSAVVTELATEHPPAGLVLRSPFVDLASVGRVHYPFLPVRTLLTDCYPLADHLAGVKVPTTVVYGSRDSIVPPEQSRAVAAVAAGETRVVEIAGADHNDLALLEGEKLIEAVIELAERVCDPRTRRARGTPRPSPPSA
jgi:pimeloyl-ACP methyl ester carboxylesterase